MLEQINVSLIDWSRAQFALTAMFHWHFVPLTLGLALLMGIMETLYVATGKEQWKHYTKFWMKIFGINFVIGVGLRSSYPNALFLLYLPFASAPRNFQSRLKISRV